MTLDYQPSMAWLYEQSYWSLSILISVFVVASTFLLTTLRSHLSRRQTGDNKSPPTAPYLFPLAGNVFSFGFDTYGFVTRTLTTFGSGQPVRINIATQNLYLISGAESILSLFKQSRELETDTATTRIIEKAFGSPSSTRHIYARDNTGIFSQPLEGSNDLETHNRIFHTVHKTMNHNLTGPGLIELGSRIIDNLENELKTLQIGEEWAEIRDFYALIQKTVFKASTTAICGPHIFRLNPTFTEDFWNFDFRISGLFKGLPRWMIPRSYRVRDKLNTSIQKWHAFAAKKFEWENEQIQKAEWEQYYGSKLIRERARDFGAIDGFNEEAHAAADLGMIWGANANVIPLIGWMLIDIILRPSLHTRILHEVNHSHTLSHLLTNPLLLSLHAEELRLRFGFLVTRTPRTNNFHINSHHFPKGEMILASTWHEHRDRSVWNEGPVDGVLHSVDEFWAERFLVFDGVEGSGPRKGNCDVPASQQKAQKIRKDGFEENETRFTADSVAGSYFPYGGGAKICPGRFYAKQEAIGSMALFLRMFEIELLEEDVFPTPDMGFFPFGVLAPKEKVGVRMRRRIS